MVTAECSCFVENLVRCNRTVRHHVAGDNSLYTLIVKHTSGAKMLLSDLHCPSETSACCQLRGI